MTDVLTPEDSQSRRSRIFHMETDLQNQSRVLYSTCTAISHFDSVTGTENMGAYEDGPLSNDYPNENLKQMKGFVQIDNSSIIATITDVHCVVIFNITTSQPYTASLFAGTCGSSGFSDAVGANARFQLPVGIVRNEKNPSAVIVADYQNCRLRSVDLVSRQVSTLKYISSNAQPVCMLWYGERLLVSTIVGIFTLEFSDNGINVTSQVRLSSSDGSQSYGKFDQVQLNTIHNFELIDDHLIMVAHNEEGILFLMDMVRNITMPVCIESTGCIASSKVKLKTVGENSEHEHVFGTVMTNEGMFVAHATGIVRLTG